MAETAPLCVSAVGLWWIEAKSGCVDEAEGVAGMGIWKTFTRASSPAAMYRMLPSGEN